MSDKDRELCWKVGKSCREPYGPRGKVLPKDIGRRIFWRVRKEKRWLEMS